MTSQVVEVPVKTPPPRKVVLTLGANPVIPPIELLSPEALESDAELKAALKKILADYKEVLPNLEFTYIRSMGDRGDWELHGGITVAWLKPPHPSNSLVVALSVCHPKEPFNKLMGRFKAASDLSTGHYVTIRLPDKGHYSIQLKAFLAFMLLRPGNPMELEMQHGVRPPRIAFEAEEDFE